MPDTNLKNDLSLCCLGLPRLLLPPTVVSAKCAEVLLSWKAFQEDDDIGTGPVMAYTSVY